MMAITGGVRYRIKGVLFDTDEFFGSDNILIAKGNY